MLLAKIYLIYSLFYCFIPSIMTVYACSAMDNDISSGCLMPRLHQRNKLRATSCAGVNQA